MENPGSQDGESYQAVLLRTVVRVSEALRAAKVRVGMRATETPLDWLAKVYDGGVLVDLLFNPNDRPVTDEVLARAETRRLPGSRRYTRTGRVDDHNVGSQRRAPRPAAAHRQLPTELRTDMKALTWQGRRDVRVESVPDPVLREPDDIIVRITSSDGFRRRDAQIHCPGQQHGAEAFLLPAFSLGKTLSARGLAGSRVPRRGGGGTDRCCSATSAVSASSGASIAPSSSSRSLSLTGCCWSATSGPGLERVLAHDGEFLPIGCSVRGQRGEQGAHLRVLQRARDIGLRDDTDELMAVDHR